LKHLPPVLQCTCGIPCVHVHVCMLACAPARAQVETAVARRIICIVCCFQMQHTPHITSLFAAAGSMPGERCNKNMVLRGCILVPGSSSVCALTGLSGLVTRGWQQHPSIAPFTSSFKGKMCTYAIRQLCMLLQQKQSVLLIAACLYLRVARQPCFGTQLSSVCTYLFVCFCLSTLVASRT
jgi:hypothetical protein